MELTGGNYKNWEMIECGVRRRSTSSSLLRTRPSHLPLLLAFLKVATSPNTSSDIGILLCVLTTNLPSALSAPHSSWICSGSRASSSGRSAVIEGLVVIESNIEIENSLRSKDKPHFLVSYTIILLTYVGPCEPRTAKARSDGGSCRTGTSPSGYTSVRSSL